MINDKVQRSAQLADFLSRPQTSFINGKAVPAGSQHRVAVFDPTSGEQLGDVYEADAAEVALAAKAARAAFEDGRWSKKTVAERQAGLMKIHDAILANLDELSEIESACTGLPMSHMKSFLMPRTAYNFKFFAEFIGQMGGDLYTQEPGFVTSVFREPVGVAGLLGPWNAPVTLGSMKIAAAISFGNSCVIKPSEVAAAGMQRFMEIIHSTGLPPGVVNMVNGRGPVTGVALVEHEDVNVVSFTGGTVTGRAIMTSAAKGLKAATMELGGKSANIICADADFERALDAALLSIYGSNGQMCLAGSRILVEKSIADKFIKAFVERAKKIKVGHPSAPDTELGPLATKAHMERVLSFVDIATAEGAELLCGGKRIDNMGGGYFMEPTAVLAKDNSSRVCQDEIFGPFATFVTFETFDEAIKMANDSPFGLVGYLWTTNLDKANQATRELHTGTVWINTPVVRDLRSAFGGYRESGIGREGGKGCMALYTEEKTVMMATAKNPMHRMGAH